MHQQRGAIVNSVNYSRIKLELEHRRITIKDFCREIDVTEQGLHQMIRNGSMKIDVLERISKVLDLPVSHWFDESTGDAARCNEPVKLSEYQKIDNVTAELNRLLKSLVGKRSEQNPV